MCDMFKTIPHTRMSASPACLIDDSGQRYVPSGTASGACAGGADGILYDKDAPTSDKKKVSPILIGGLAATAVAAIAVAIFVYTRKR